MTAETFLYIFPFYKIVIIDPPFLLFPWTYCNYALIAVNYFGKLHLRCLTGFWVHTAQKMKFTIKDFFSKCDQIRRKLRIWSHLLKKSLKENFIFCTVETLTPDLFLSNLPSNSFSCSEELALVNSVAILLRWHLC